MRRRALANSRSFGSVKMTEEHMEEGFVTPFGKVLGAFEGVEGRSNGSDRHFSGEQHFVDGVYTGYKYQCVEYARRWLLSKGLAFHSVPLAAHIWNIRFMERVKDEKPTAVRRVDNGAREPPRTGDIIIWKIAQEVPYGHVAVVTGVDLEKSWVRIAEQNMENDEWPGDYAREIRMEEEMGRFWVRDEHEIYGWLVVNFEVDDQDPAELGNIEVPVKRHVIANKPFTETNCEIQKKFLNVWADAYNSIQQTSYYTIEAHLAYKIKYASMESGFMCMRSTNYVISHPELYEKFGFPEWSWSHIERSLDHYWNGDGKAITGRVEFGFNGRHIKVSKLLSDSLEGFAESCYFQDVLSRKLGIDIGKSPQADLYKQLVEHLKDCTKGFVHIMTRHEKNDGYLVEFLQRVLKDAGRDSKVINIDGFKRSHEEGWADNEGKKIGIVWKTFTWQWVIDNSSEPGSTAEPQLIDLLLSDKVTTFEPVWKVVSSSPAIIPVIYKQFTNHIYLRASDWQMSDLLAGKEVETVNYTAGGREFSYLIEKFEREKFDGHTPLIESWLLGRRLAGFGFCEEGIERLPVYCTRIINDD